MRPQNELWQCFANHLRPWTWSCEWEKSSICAFLILNQSSWEATTLCNCFARARDEEFFKKNRKIQRKAKMIHDLTQFLHRAHDANATDCRMWIGLNARELLCCFDNIDSKYRARAWMMLMLFVFSFQLHNHVLLWFHFCELQAKPQKRCVYSALTASWM